MQIQSILDGFGNADYKIDCIVQQIENYLKVFGEL